MVAAQQVTAVATALLHVVMWLTEMAEHAASVAAVEMASAAVAVYHEASACPSGPTEDPLVQSSVYGRAPSAGSGWRPCVVMSPGARGMHGGGPVHGADGVGKHAHTGPHEGRLPGGFLCWFPAVR